MAFLANGYSVKYVAIDYAERAGDVEVPLVAATRSATCIQVIRMVLSYNPLRVFLPLAMVARPVGRREARLRLVRYNFRRRSTRC